MDDTEEAESAPAADSARQVDWEPAAEAAIGDRRRALQERCGTSWAEIASRLRAPVMRAFSSPLATKQAYGRVAVPSSLVWKSPPGWFSIEGATELWNRPVNCVKCEASRRAVSKRDGRVLKRRDRSFGNEPDAVNEGIAERDDGDERAVRNPGEKRLHEQFG